MTLPDSNPTVNIWEIITAISSFVMAVAASFAVITYSVTKRTQYLSTIESCSKEYRKYMRLIQNGEGLKTVKRDLLGLFHKQLFYIQNNYVPKNIKIEWIKTMHFVLQENVLSKKADTKQYFTEEFTYKDWMDSFDRVRIFMSEKGTAEIVDGKYRIEKKILKHYRRKYFRCNQRVFLFQSEKWKEAFENQLAI